jgi:hypothetical protein
MSKIDNALEYLTQLIAEGWEYPEAEFKASEKFKVNYQKLRDAYDTYCRD